jgi:hypothetical protein
MGNQFTTTWSTEAVEYLRDKAEQRWSATEIADGLQNDLGFVITSNAVIGKAHRAGIKLSGFIWSDAMMKVLREKAAAGLHPNEIARELQQLGFNITRKQITDKAYRDKIKLVTSKPSSPPAPPKTMHQRIVEKRIAMAAEWVDHESDQLVSSRPCTLLELKGHQCKWPLRRNERGERMFCGAFKITGPNPDRPNPYCPTHLQLSIDSSERISSNGQKQAA